MADDNANRHVAGNGALAQPPETPTGKVKKPVTVGMTKLDEMELKKIESEKDLGDVEKALTSMKETQEEKEDAKSKTMTFNRRYTTKKTIGKGVLDSGLLLMSIAQLKLLVSLGPDRLDFFWPNITLIIISIILQIVVGVVLTILGASEVRSRKDKRRAVRLNDASLVLIFIITTVNTIVAAVGVSETDVPQAQ